jgi:hypothetical protein
MTDGIQAQFKRLQAGWGVTRDLIVLIARRAEASPLRRTSASA